MKLLRQLIRHILLEGPVKDEFDEAWYNTEIERETERYTDTDRKRYREIKVRFMELIL